MLNRDKLLGRNPRSPYHKISESDSEKLLNHSQIKLFNLIRDEIQLWKKELIGSIERSKVITNSLSNKLYSNLAIHITNLFEVHPRILLGDKVYKR